jgi:antitoxin component of RelBE/YafQ-DinJ toxin-antitoxin module
MPTSMSQPEVLSLATELYSAIYDVARRYGMTFDQVIEILVRTKALDGTYRTA